MKIVKLTALIPTVFVSLIVIGLFVWVIEPHEPVSNAEPAKTAPVIDKYREGPPERQELLELVNKERARVGVKPLKLHTALNKSAQYKAEDMVNRNYFSHTAPGTNKNNGLDYLDTIFTECDIAGENITDNTTSEDNYSYQSYFSWRHSKPHYKAMIDGKYDYTGFGVAGTKVVQHFCDLR